MYRRSLTLGCAATFLALQASPTRAAGDAANKNRGVLNLAGDWQDQLAWALNTQVLGNELYRFGALAAAVLAAGMLGELLRAVFKRLAARMRAGQQLVLSTVLDSSVRHVNRGALILGAIIGLQFLNLDYAIRGIAVERYIELGVALYLSVIVGELLQFALARLSGVFRNRNRVLMSTAFDSLSRSAKLCAIALGIAAGVQCLYADMESVPATAGKAVDVLALLACAFVGWCLVDVVDRWLSGFSRRTASRLDDMLLPIMRTMLRGAVALMVFIQIAGTLSDQPPTSILAGLGVGGLAIGLAAQESIKNFFGSVMIFSDRPFELGDLIRVDAQEGRVEGVGFRSTRLRTAEGHLVTIPNGDLAGKTILNIAKRPHLRRQINLRLHPTTPPEKVERAVEIVREILDRHEGMDPANPPVVMFSEINDTALNIQATYYFPPQEGGRFAAFGERVNFEIIRRFHAAGIELASQKPLVA